MRHAPPACPPVETVAVPDLLSGRRYYFHQKPDVATAIRP